MFGNRAVPCDMELGLSFPGGLHARGEGERVLALESREGTRASRQESQASFCLRKGTPLASRAAQGVSGPSSSCVWNPRVFADDARVAYQAPQSIGFSRQEYWSGLPCPPPGDLLEPGIKPASLMPPAWAGGFSWDASPRGEALFRCARPSGVPRGPATSTGSLASPLATRGEDWASQGQPKQSLGIIC